MASKSLLRANIAENERIIKYRQREIDTIEEVLPLLRQDRKEIEKCKNYHKRTLDKKWFWKGPKYDNYSVYHYKATSLANNQLATVDYTIRAAEEYKKSATEWIAECQAEIDQWEYQLAHWDDD